MLHPEPFPCIKKGASYKSENNYKESAETQSAIKWAITELHSRCSPTRGDYVSNLKFEENRVCRL